MAIIKRLGLPFGAILILGLAHFCHAYKVASVSKIVNSQDGSAVAIVEFDNGCKPEIWAWPPDLSECRELLTLPESPRNGLTVNASGDLAIVRSGKTVIAVNPRSGQQLWRSRIPAQMGGDSHCFLLSDEEFVVVASGNVPTYTGTHDKNAWLAQSVNVLDASTGKVIADLNQARPIVAEICIQGDEVACTYWQDSRRHIDHYRITKNGLEELGHNLERQPENFRHKWDYKSQGLRPSTRRPEWENMVRWLPAGNRTRTVMLKSQISGAFVRLQTLGVTGFRILKMFVAILFGIWVWCAAHRKSSDNLNVLIEMGLIATFSGLVSLRFSEAPGDAFQTNTLSLYSLAPNAIAIAYICIFALTGVLSYKSSRISWAAVFAVATLPMTLPFVGVALLTRMVGGTFGRESSEPQAVVTPRVENSKQPRFQFGIAEMLLSTAAFALFISIGTYSVELVIPACAFALPIYAFVAFASSQNLAKLMLLVAAPTVAVTALSVTHSWEGLITLWLATCAMLIGYSAVRGYRVRLLRADVTANAETD